MEERIANFIDMFGTPCPDPTTETLDQVELIMDTHHWIVLDGQQWYVPKNSVLYSEEDENVLNYLLEVNQAREL